MFPTETVSEFQFSPPVTCAQMIADTELFPPHLIGIFMTVSFIFFISGKFPITRLADCSVRLEHLKRAVLKVMVMNNHLYRFLYSNTFDVPEYEKDNIAYNSQVRI